MKPLKRFGQNFLTDPRYISKIVDTFNPLPDDSVLEIGPGKGAITEKLLDSGCDLRVAEIDTRAIELLHEKYPSLQIIEGDFMEVWLREVAGGRKLRVVGNIPYNITTPIIFKLLEEREHVNDVMLMVQLEVARRITAPPNNKEYGILSVVLGVYATLTYHFKVPSTVFFPKPKVDSAIITLKFDQDENLIKDHKLFRKVVRTAFNQRRKTLRNALSPVLETLPKGYISPVDLGRRAEQLTPEEFIHLANTMSNAIETERH